MSWSSADRTAAPPAELIAYGHFSKRSKERYGDLLIPFPLWRAWSAALREWLGPLLPSRPSYALMKGPKGERLPVIFDGTYVATVLPARRQHRPAPVGYPNGLEG